MLKQVMFALSGVGLAHVHGAEVGSVPMGGGTAPAFVVDAGSVEEQPSVTFGPESPAGSELPNHACFAPGTELTPALLAEVAALGRGSSNPYDNRYNTFLNRRNAPTVLTWSLVPDGTALAGLRVGSGGSAVDLPATNSTLFALMNANVPNQDQWIGYLQQVFDRYQALTGVRFERVRFNGQPWDDGAPVGDTRNPAPGLRGDIRIMARPVDGPSRILAFAGSHITFDSQDSWNDNVNSYRFLRNVFSHELGHALGLAHVCPLNNTKLMEPIATTAFDGPQQDDLRGIQQIFGDPYEPNNFSGQATRLPDTIPLTAFTLLDYPFAAGQPGQLTAASLIDMSSGGDVDWYISDATAAVPLTITIEPRGETYDSSTQNSDASCNSGSLIDSRRQCRLNVELYQGGVRLQQATAAAAGESVTVSVPQVATGSYLVKVWTTDRNFSTQSYRMLRTAGAPTPPDNDACAASRNRLTWPVGGTTFGATNDGNAFLEPGGFNDARDVYYRWTATGTGRIRVTATPTQGHTGVVVSIHNGTRCPATSANQLSIPDSSRGGGNGVVDADVIRGNIYRIRVANADRTSLGGSFDLNLQYLNEPANSPCAAATVINQPDSVFTGNLDFARGSVAQGCGGPLQIPTFNRSVWYAYTAFSDSELSINTCGSNFDTYLVVYDRCPLEGDAPLACNDDGGFCNPINSSLTLQVPGGQTRYIRLTDGSFFNANPNDSFVLNVSVRPSNDTCAGPQTVAPGAFAFDNAYGRDELPAEPGCFPAAGGRVNHDVWYRFTSTCTSTATLQIAQQTTSAPALVAVYPGCPSAAGTALACGAFASPGALNFPVRSGASYLVRVGSGAPTVRVAGTMAVSLNCPVCTADVDDGSGSGIPDGGVTVEDLLYYLDLYEGGDVRADVDDGTGSGTRDGGVTIEDLLYFLLRYDGGC